MKIKKNNNQLIIETTKAKTVYPIIGMVKNSENFDILLTHELEELKVQDVRIINRPGEYETNDVFVYAFSKMGDKVDVFAIEADHLSLMVTSNDRNAIKTSDLDKVNSTNILICIINTLDFEQIRELIEEVEPNVLIITGENEEYLDAFVKKTSLNMAGETQSSYIFAEEEFENELETSMKVFILK